MIVIPYSTSLDLARRPWVTVGIIVLCLVIHLQADARQATVAQRIEQFCASEQGSQVGAQFDRFLDRSTDSCEVLFEARHDAGEEERFRDALRAYAEEAFGYTPEDSRELVDQIEAAYQTLRADLPTYLQNWMAQYPPSLNPVAMVLSSFAHADWWHVLGNLVFFYAFAAPVEVIAGPVLFAAAILLLSVICGVAYSVFCLFAGGCAPTIGLSGVVMGVIGIAAFVMPKARVNTVLMHGILGWRFSIPAWVLALFFISGDLWNLFGGAMEGSGIDFVSHVAGGLGGYLSARLLLRSLRDDVRDDLDDAIEIAALGRGAKDASLVRPRISRRQLEREIRTEAARKEALAFSDALCRWVRANESSRALLLVLKDYDLWSLSPEIYEDIFEEVGNLERGRAWVCIGRLGIHLYMRMGRYGRAVALAEQLVAEVPNVEVASPEEALRLAHEALSMNRPQLATALLSDPYARYGGCLDQEKAADLLRLAGQE